MAVPPSQVRITAEDFHERVVAAGEGADVLVYMYFPGKTVDARSIRTSPTPQASSISHALALSCVHGVSP